MHAIGIIPVIRQLMGLARQVWYADDAAAGDNLLQLKDWWSELLSSGHHFGYHVNAAKTWLVVKQEYLAPAQRIFDGTGIQIMSAGRPYLGVPIGSQDFITDYTQNHISQWVQSRVETRSGHPGNSGHIFSASFGSDPLYKYPGLTRIDCTIRVFRSFGAWITHS